MWQRGFVDPILGLVAGALAFLWFAPTGGDDSYPPVCTNLAGRAASCETAPSVAWALIAFLVVVLTARAVRSRTADERPVEE